MKSCENYDRTLLQRLLNESLPDAVECDVADHVASCVTCQQELESLAAQRDWWTEASYRLSQSSAEVDSLKIARINRGTNQTIEASEHRASESDASRKGTYSPLAPSSCGDPFDEAYTTDFAVDFLEPSDDPTVLGRLGEYEIREVIGRGGMGIVLKGFQKELHRFVAVKVLSPNLATSGAARRRFAREAQATAAVVNPHVMAIHSVHANSRLPYLVMPFVECESLQQRLDRVGAVDLKDILRIGMQAARGLAAAHAQGLVHRDVKPANILLETNVDRVMLTDFGLARAVDDATLTRTGIIAGTPQYMSPEQANGDAIDHRSDLFSLGSVLYAMSTARPPFRAETTFGVLRRIRETEPRPIREINPDIPEWFEQVVYRLLAKSPQDRITTATEVAELLEQCLAHVQQPTTVALPIEVPKVAREKSNPNSVIHRAAKSKWVFLAFISVTLFSPMILWWQTDRNVSNAPPEAASSNVSTDDVVQPDTNEAIDETFEWNGPQKELGRLNQALDQIETNVVPDIGQQ